MKFFVLEQEYKNLRKIIHREDKFKFEMHVLIT